MNIKLKKILATGYLLLATGLLFVPMSFNIAESDFFGIENVYADDPDPDYDPGGGTGSEEPRILPRCGKGDDLIGSERYDLNSFLWLLILILRWIFSITGSLAVLMFVYGGYMWLLSAGEEKRVTEGRTTMINAVIGVGIILGSWLGVNVVVATLTGAPQGTNSIAWNNVGAHCKGYREDKFVKIKPTPTTPPGGRSPSTSLSPVSPTSSVTPTPPPKCTDPGAPPCPTNKRCDMTPTSPTYGQCIDDIPSGGGCNPPCTGIKKCNPTTKQCEPPKSECCFTVLVEDDCVDFDTPPNMEAKYLRPSTENLCTNDTLTNFTTRPEIFGEENEGCPGAGLFKGIKRKIINRNFCEYKKCDHMNAFTGTWTCK